jgi:hypothetical protein
LERAELVRRLLTCFLAGDEEVPVARDPRPPEPATGPALRDLLRLAVVFAAAVGLVLRLLRFVAVDLIPDFFSSSLIALLTIPEIKVSMTPDMPAPSRSAAPGAQLSVPVETVSVHRRSEVCRTYSGADV